MKITSRPKKRKQTRQQEQHHAKTIWRPVSPHQKEINDNMQQEPALPGMLSTIHTHNIYTNIDMKEHPVKDTAMEDNSRIATDHETQLFQE